ncbi:MAG: S8 family serine peptidase [Bacteroidia bacterium]
MNFRIAIFTLIICFSSLAGFSQETLPTYHQGQIYVSLDTSFERPTSLKPNQQVLDFFSVFSDQFQITDIRAGFYLSKENIANTYKITFNNSSETAEFIKLIEELDHVNYAERIPISRFHEFPNDLGPNTTGNNGQYYLYKIQAPSAWDILNQGNPNIVVAVIDDACQTNHPEISGFTTNPFNVVDNSNNVEPTNINWDHGTFIAGLITAKTNNGEGMASVGRGLRVMPIRVTNNANPDLLFNEYEAVIYAISQGVEVMNLSWGNEVPSQTGLSAINNAYNAGVVVVASAGNDNNSNVVYPAAYPNVISVASTTQIDTKSTFSGFGTWIDICAPGSLLWSIAPTDSYTVKSGTSFSAPLVSAAAGMMLSINPDLTPDEVRACLLSSADNINLFNPDYLGLLGAGRLNLRNALQCVESKESAYDVWLTEIISPSVSSCESNSPLQVRVINSGSDTVFSMNIRWQLDDEFAITEPWNDTLPPGEAVIINLSDIDAIPGTHSLRVTILDVLNSINFDAYPSNNVIIFPFEVLSPVGILLPFQDSFESGNFNSNGWTNINEDSDFGWEIALSSGTIPGNRSARLPYYIDFEPGNRDYLVSPGFNLSGYSSVTMSFEYAYQQRTPGLSDTLIISVSTDCGESWIRLSTQSENDFYSFATLPYAGSFFIPQIPEDWCVASSFISCMDIDLSGFAGMTGVRVRFEGYNNSGNNIYIDNVNISGDLAELSPVANFNANGNLQVCLGEPVVFTNTSYNNPQLYKWSFPGAFVDSSLAFEPVVQYPDTGTYDVELIVSNDLGSDTLAFSSYITVLPNPEILVTVNPDSICRGESATLYASGGVAYFWSAASGLSPTYADTVTVSPQTTTSYMVTGVSQEGCTNSASNQIVVILAPALPTISTLDTILISSVADEYQWFVNGVIIEGATSQLHVPQINGNYNVRVFNEFGCTSISNPFNVTWVGIENLYLDQSIELFPNPAVDLLTVKSTNNLNSLIVFSAQGQVITQHSEINANTFNLDLSEIAQGYYLVKINSDKGSATIPFVRID